MDFFNTLLLTSSNQWTVGLAIIVGTYILEDVAIITAALLSSANKISPYWAFFTLLIGIVTGDIGLYLLGYALKNIPKLQNKIGLKRIQRGKAWLGSKMFLSILLVRMIPGLRLPVYSACGFFRLPFLKFSLTVFIACILWTGLIFTGVFIFGKLFWIKLSEYKWYLLPILLLLLIFFHSKLTQYINHRHKIEND